jgi:hypothetical protein
VEIEIVEIEALDGARAEIHHNREGPNGLRPRRRGGDSRIQRGPHVQGRRRRQLTRCLSRRIRAGDQWPKAFEQTLFGSVATD